MWSIASGAIGTKLFKAVVGLSVLPMMTISLLANGQPASSASLDAIAELADRAYEVRQRLRTAGTLNEEMRKSAALLLCEMNEGGLKGALGASIKALAKGQDGGGVKYPSFGEHAKFELTPMNSWALSTGLKLSALTNFCLALDNLGGQWADIEPLDNLSDFEDPYKHYVPSGAGGSGSGSENVIVSDQSRTQKLSGVFDITATALLDTLVDGYVAMGLDPSNEEHVKAILFGPDVVGAVDDMVNFVEDPLEMPLRAVGMIRDRIEEIPFLDDLNDALDSLLSIETFEDPCGSDFSIVPSGACDTAEAFIGFVTDAAAIAADLPDLETVAGELATVASDVRGLMDVVYDDIDQLQYWVDRSLQWNPVDIGQMTTFANKLPLFLTSIVDEVGKIEDTITDLVSSYSISDSGAGSVPMGICGFGYKFRAGLENPSFDVKMDCMDTEEELEQFVQSLEGAGIYVFDSFDTATSWIDSVVSDALDFFGL